MFINYGMKVGDILEIDSVENTIRLNGVERPDLLYQSTANSFPCLSGEKNNWVIADDTFFGTHGKALIGDLCYYDVI